MLIFALLSASAALLLFIAYHTYMRVPLPELKRRARSDEIAAALYRVSAHQANAKVVFLVPIVVLAYLATILSYKYDGLWVTAVTWLLFAGLGAALTADRAWTKKLCNRIGQFLAPVSAGIIRWFYPLISKLVRAIKKLRPIRFHTGVYEKQDIVGLLKSQATLDDNRVGKSELELVERSLSFGDKKVSEVLTPKRMVISVSVDDSIGPLLMDELYKSGHSRFVVYEGAKDNIAGLLYLHDLVKTGGSGRVSDLLRRKVTYIHEDFTLMQALQAFTRTKQQLFVVVNEFEEFVGVLTLEDVVGELIGSPIVDEFDQYDDLRAVAASIAQKDHSAHDEPAEKDASSEDQIKTTPVKNTNQD